MPESLEQVPGGTGWYVYGVVPSQARVPDGLVGLDEAPVSLVAYEGVAALVSEVALDRPPGRRAEVVAHSSVLDAVAEHGPVIPVQFGSVVVDDDSIVGDLLEPSHDRFLHRLDRLSGHHQMNLRASYVEEQVLGEVVQAHPEIADLRERTRDLPPGSVHPDLVRLGELVSQVMERKRAEDSEVILDVVEPLVTDVSDRQGGGVDHLLDVALLVAEDGIGDLEDALEDLAATVHERIRLRLVGPVAPYDFAEEEGWG